MHITHANNQTYRQLLTSYTVSSATSGKSYQTRISLTTIHFILQAWFPGSQVHNLPYYRVLATAINLWQHKAKWWRKYRQIECKSRCWNKLFVLFFPRMKFFHNRCIAALILQCSVISVLWFKWNLVTRCTQYVIIAHSSLTASPYQ